RGRACIEIDPTADRRGARVRSGPGHHPDGARASGMKRHFLSAADLTRDEALELFALAAELKQRRKAGRPSATLAGKTFALIFEKPSLRTRMTFEVGITQLGGHAVHLAAREIGLGTRETVPDVARNLSGRVDGIMAAAYAPPPTTAPPPP